MVGGFDNPNANGVYHKAFKSICPYDGSRQTVHYFYRHKVGPPPPQTICAVLPVVHIMNSNLLKNIGKKKKKIGTMLTCKVLIKSLIVKL